MICDFCIKGAILYEKNLKQNAYEAGMEAGMNTARIESIENLMKSLKISAEEACRLLNIAYEEYEQAK